LSYPNGCRNRRFQAHRLLRSRTPARGRSTRGPGIVAAPATSRIPWPRSTLAAHTPPRKPTGGGIGPRRARRARLWNPSCRGACRNNSVSGQAPPRRPRPRLDWAGEGDWISFDGNGHIRIRRDQGLRGTHSQAHADGCKKKLMSSVYNFRPVTGTLRIWRWPRPGTRHGSAYEADAGSPLARSCGDETATAFPAGRSTPVLSGPTQWPGQSAQSCNVPPAARRPER
jgi:hypothetical protein